MTGVFEHPNWNFPSYLILYLECGLLTLAVVWATVRHWRAAAASHPTPLSHPAHSPHPARRSYRTVFAWTAVCPSSKVGLITTAGLVGFAGSALLTLLLGFPSSGTADSTAYRLTAATFASGHLVNPPAPHRAVVPEQVLATPVYTGKYPPGQSAVLALGFLLGQPAIALWLESGLLAAAMVWCLLGWMPRRWAVLGAVLVLLRLCIGSYWNRTYWGGSVAAIGSALVFGGLGRLLDGGRGRDLIALCVGLAVLALTRPYEGLLAALPVLLWLVTWLWRRFSTAPGAALRSVALMSAVLLPTVAFIAYYNVRTTGSPVRFAHQVYEEQRQVAGEFLWQRWIRSEGRFSWVDVDLPAGERDGWWRPAVGFFVHRTMTSAYFLIGPTLLLAVIVTLPVLLRRPGMPLLLTSFLLTVSGHSIVHFYFPHYSAPITAPLWILGLIALRILWLRRLPAFPQGAALVGAALAIEIISFAAQLPALRPAPSEQQLVVARLVELGGKHLVLVKPPAAHVDNLRDLTDVPVLWAADLGAKSTRSLLEVYPDRELWRFDPYAAEPLSRVRRADLEPDSPANPLG